MCLIRQRMLSGKLAKAERGELAFQLGFVGLVKDFAQLPSRREPTIHDRDHD